MSGVAQVEECEAAGLDPDEVEKIAKGISRYAKQADKLGLTVFGGAGQGSLRFYQDGNDHALIVGYLDGTFDGGDGATSWDHEGLERGE